MVVLPYGSRHNNSHRSLTVNYIYIPYPYIKEKGKEKEKLMLRQQCRAACLQRLLQPRNTVRTQHGGNEL